MSLKTILLKIFFVALLFFGIPIRIDDSNELKDNFENFLKDFNKSYNETEYQNRFIIFKNSLDVIDKLNSIRESNSSAVYGITKFSDLTSEEFLNQFLQPKLYERINHHQRAHLQHHHHHHYKNNHNVKKREILEILNVKDLPKAIDWRNKGIISSIYNQKTCGACWAFSAIETIESMNAMMKPGIVQRLSVQQMIDCANNGNTGCTGGDTCSLLEWLAKKNIKIAYENDYPLTLQTGTCKMSNETKGIQINSNFICDNFSKQEEKLLSLLAYHGPITAAVNALNWQNYLGGIIQFNCDSDVRQINHAVQIVGYNLTSPIPHYIVRNSWGEDFGIHGYLYIAIGNNICGMANEVSTVDIIL